jgi:hypothetical protein
MFILFFSFLFLSSFFILSSPSLLFFSCSPASLSLYIPHLPNLNCTFWSSLPLSYGSFSSPPPCSFSTLRFHICRLLSILLILLPLLLLVPFLYWGHSRLHGILLDCGRYKVIPLLKYDAKRAWRESPHILELYTS